MKNIATFLIIFFIGALGGIFGDRILFSFLAGKPPFSDIPFIRDGARGTTIIQRREEVVVRENERLSETVLKESAVVVGVRSVAGETTYQGTGFILTGDGIVATSNDLLLPGAFNEVVRGGIRFTATVLTRDSVSGIAILKIDGGNLPVVTFYEEDVRLGDPVFLLGRETGKDTSDLSVDTGIVRRKTEDSFETTIESLKFSASGSPLFALNGKLMGMALVRKGAVSIAPAESIKGALASALKHD